MRGCLRRRVISLVSSLAVLCLFLWLLIIAVPTFDEPESPVLFDRNGFLLSARIAEDGQWRFPESKQVPKKFETCILAFEDQYFYWHPGINPISFFRALKTNISAGEVRSGGSTITMQLMRLARKGTPRTYSEKIVETALALGAELKLSKQEILAQYASHAPFGGNIVGLDAASWRYFGRAASDLSWAEAATLAVLPNAPALVHASRNREVLKTKRDRLLLKLHRTGALDALELQLALAEQLPDAPIPLPDEAPHYLQYLLNQNTRWPAYSSLDRPMQRIARAILKRHQPVLTANMIRHAAIIVRHIKSGEVLVYQGNSAVDPNDDAIYNDMIQTPRSSGSILKPFLFAASLDEGKILQGSLVEDVPVWIGGFSPRNFDEKYAGALSASEALRRSLNVPFVLMLREYGEDKFLNLLRKIGFSTLSFDAAHYGLSLILGGGEVTLFELTAAYRDFARVMETDSLSFPISQGAAWLTTNVLQTLNRPYTETGWHYFGSGLQMAWKTGTSYGFRDAWAIGYTPDYVIGVWVGNADGSGRPGLTGVSAAAPILFDMASALVQPTSWFDQPAQQLTPLVICNATGFLAGPFCDIRDTILTTLQGKTSRVCPYHKPFQLDASGRFRINADCEYAGKVQTRNLLSFPPQLAHFYGMSHPEFHHVPPLMPGCSKGDEQPMSFLYPPPNAVIFRPIDFNGQANPVVAEVAHHQQNVTLFWHLDDAYLGETRGNNHRLSFSPSEGSHLLSVVDEQGNSIKIRFRIVSKQ